MGKMESCQLIAGLNLICLLFFSLPAYAYLDPGTGAYLAQIIVGGLLALGLTFNRFKTAIFEAICKRKSKKKGQE
jgi:hypothetical protein